MSVARHSVRNNYKRCGHYVDLVRHDISRLLVAHASNDVSSARRDGSRSRCLVPCRSQFSLPCWRLDSMRRSLLQVQHVASQELRPTPLHGDLLAIVSPLAYPHRAMVSLVPPLLHFLLSAASSPSNIVCSPFFSSRLT